MARSYKLKKRLEKAYANYKSRYIKKKASLNRRGFEMADTMLTEREYQMVRQAYVNEGVTININQTIVAEQAYEYSLATAQRFKETAEKYNLDWKNKTITELRKGQIDVSQINNVLKEEHPDWSGVERQKYISYEVFGSE